MPSKSPAQAHLMAAVAHNPKFAAKVGIPQSVGRDFNQADKRNKDNLDRRAMIARLVEKHGNTK